MKQFLHSVKSETGCFSMHVGGEEDTRAVYCACVIGAYLKAVGSFFSLIFFYRKISDP